MEQIDPSLISTGEVPPNPTKINPGNRLKKNQEKVNKKRQKVATIKNFILDTNVLLHDPNCIQRFDDNHVWIPVDVLSELDKFKNEQSERGANARAVHRSLSKIFSLNTASVTDGVATIGGGTLRLAVFDVDGKDKSSEALARFHRIFPDTERVDHRILATVLLVQETNPLPAILITKDLNMQLKALAVGLNCEDYLSDKVEAKDVDSYDPQILEIDTYELQRFASSGELQLDATRGTHLVLNEYVLLRAGDRKTMPARFAANGLFKRLKIPETLHIPRGIDLHPAGVPAKPGYALQGTGWRFA